MAGVVQVTRESIVFPQTGRKIQKVTIDWTGDASVGSVPDTDVEGLHGYLLKAITKPSSPAPTDNYDISLMEPDAANIDAANALLQNRDTTNQEVVYPYVTSAVTPVILCGTYKFKLSGNSVASAKGQLILFVSENL